MDKKSKKSVLKASDFRKEPKLFCMLKFHNDLPMVPCEQKLLAYPFESDRFCAYNTTSLESEALPGLLLPLDLGIKVDLVNPDVYTPVPGELDPEDEELLAAPVDKKEKKPNKYSTSSSMYLRKSTLPAGPIVYSVKQPAEIAETIEEDYDPAVHIPKIAEGFGQTEFRHPTKPSLKPSKVFEVFPENSFIQNEFVVFAFDEDPPAEGLRLLKEQVDAQRENVLSFYTESSDTHVSHQRNYKFSYFNDPNQNDVVLWLNEEENVATYALVQNKLQLKKKKIAKHIPIPEDASLPPKTIEVTMRSAKLSELRFRKQKLIELDMDVESSLGSDILDNMKENEGTQNIDDVLTNLFGNLDDD